MITYFTIMARKFDITVGLAKFTVRAIQLTITVTKFIIVMA